MFRNKNISPFLLTIFPVFSIICSCAWDYIKIKVSEELNQNHIVPNFSPVDTSHMCRVSLESLKIVATYLNKYRQLAGKLGAKGESKCQFKHAIEQ